MFVCLLSFKCAFYSQMRQYSSTKNRNKHCCVSFLIASDSFSKLALLMCVCQTTDGLTWASEKRFCSTDIIVCLTCLWCMEPYPRSLIRLQSRFWFVAIRISFISQIQDRNELVPPFPVLQHRVSLGPVCGAPRISSHFLALRANYSPYWIRSGSVCWDYSWTPTWPEGLCLYLFHADLLQRFYVQGHV